MLIGLFMLGNLWFWALLSVTCVVLVAAVENETVARNKGRILSWMTWWPYSLVWTLIDDPVRRAFKEIYNRVKGIFIRIRNRAFGDISADLHADTTLD